MTDNLKRLFKNKRSILIMTGLVLGALLLLMGNGEKKNGENITAPEKSPTEMSDSYVSALETRVKKLLEDMDGVSNVSVILTPESTTEAIYAENGRFLNGEHTEKEYVISSGGEGGEPITLKLVYPRLRGIAVVCRGGANPIIQQRVINLLCALFDISSDRVYVSG